MSEFSRKPLPPDDSPLGAVSERELDEILTRTATMAGDVSQQVGVSDGSPGAPTWPPPCELSATLDDELSRLDGLVSSTAAEVGVDPSGQSALNSQNSARQEVRSAAPAPPDRAVPDFMLEFTEPAPVVPPTAEPTKSARETVAPNQTNSTASTPAVAPPTRRPPAKPGLVGTGMLGVVTTSGPVDAEDKSTPSSAESAEITDLTSQGSTKKGALHRFHAIAATLVGFIELLDRPFGAVGTGLRNLFGWIALATLGTALVVYLIAML